MSQLFMSQVSQQPTTFYFDNATFAPSKLMTPPAKEIYGEAKRQLLFPSQPSQDDAESLKRVLALSQDSEVPQPKRSRGFESHEDLADVFGDLAFQSQEPSTVEMPGAPKRPTHREIEPASVAVPRRLPMYSQPSQSQSSQPFELEDDEADVIFELLPVPVPECPAFHKLVVPRQAPSSMLRNIAVLGRNVETGIVDRRISRHQAEVYAEPESGQVVIKSSSPKPTLIHRRSGVQETLRENDSTVLEAGDVVELLKSKYSYEVVARRQDSERRISR